MIDSHKLAYLTQLKIPLWQLKSRTSSPVSSGGAYSVPQDWNELQLAVANCFSCELHQSRTQPVFGVGNRSASVMIIGEAPGFYEDQKGEPFVGRAGQLLNAMLKAIGFERSDVFIANILKCRPPNNRDPQAHEIQQCSSFLQKQIALINPTIILGLGRIAGQSLLKSQAPLGQLRGKLHTIGSNSIPLIITYHPAYLLRKPSDKRKTFNDLQLLRDILQKMTINEGK